MGAGCMKVQAWLRPTWFLGFPDSLDSGCRLKKTCCRSASSHAQALSSITAVDIFFDLSDRRFFRPFQSQSFKSGTPQHQASPASASAFTVEQLFLLPVAVQPSQPRDRRWRVSGDRELWWGMGMGRMGTSRSIRAIQLFGRAWPSDPDPTMQQLLENSQPMCWVCNTCPLRKWRTWVSCKIDSVR